MGHISARLCYWHQLSSFSTKQHWSKLSSSLFLLGHWADLMSLESFDDTCYTFKPPKVYFDPLAASEPNEVYPWIGSLSLSSSRICIVPAPLLSTTILRYRVSRAAKVPRTLGWVRIKGHKGLAIFCFFILSFGLVSRLNFTNSIRTLGRKMHGSLPNFVCLSLIANQRSRDFWIPFLIGQNEWKKQIPGRWLVLLHYRPEWLSVRAWVCIAET